jgi:hypothetical protein
VDIWSVEGVDEIELLDNGSGYFYFPESSRQNDSHWFAQTSMNDQKHSRSRCSRHFDGSGHLTSGDIPGASFGRAVIPRRRSPQLPGPGDLWKVP